MDSGLVAAGSPLERREAEGAYAHAVRDMTSFDPVAIAVDFQG